MDHLIETISVIYEVYLGWFGRPSGVILDEKARRRLEYDGNTICPPYCRESLILGDKFVPVINEKDLREGEKKRIQTSRIGISCPITFLGEKRIFRFHNFVTYDLRIQ